MYESYIDVRLVLLEKTKKQKLLSKSPALSGLRLEKDEKLENNIVVRNVFRLKNKIDGNAIKDISNLLDEKKKKMKQSTTD